MRRCIATGESRPQDELLRFVVAPDGELTFDLSGKLPGRGLWVSADRAALDRAIRRKLFARAARSAVKLPEDLEARVQLALRRRCLDLLGLANRAGLVTCGFEKVKAALSAGRAGLLLQAADGADDGRDKLAALGRAVLPGLPIVRLFTAAELGGLLGRDHLVHVMLRSGALTERLAIELSRYQGLLLSSKEKRDGAAGWAS